MKLHVRIDRSLVWISSLVLLLAASAAVAQDTSPLQPGAELKIEGAVAFTEGPAWHPSGNVYFTEIVGNRIMRRDPNGVMHVYRQPSGRANGLAFDRQGRLIACEGGGEGGNRRVTRTEANGTITVLADRYQGKRFNSPNDLVVDSNNRIFFSDPRYGDRSDLEMVDDSGRPIEGVYRIDDDGQVTRIIAHQVARPNGLAVTADRRVLYVADNVNDGPNGVGGARKLWRFELTSGGDIVPESQHLIFDWGTDRGPDGMALDRAGRLYVAAGFNKPNPPAETAEKHKAGVYIISPDGELLDFVPVPEDMVTNCTFGGDDLQTLFITAGHKLWSVRGNTPGQVTWLPPE
jgi:gluconolactonase